MNESCKHRTDSLKMNGEMHLSSGLVVLDASTRQDRKVCLLKVHAGSQTGYECTYLEANDQRCPVAIKFKQANAAERN